MIKGQTEAYKALIVYTGNSTGVRFKSDYTGNM